MSCTDPLSPPRRTDAERAAPVPAPAERDEADALVADLAALVDAGLVVVRRSPGGPARYGVSGIIPRT